MDSEREHFCLESTVRGHHVYNRTWTPFIGEVLQTATERSNEHDRFAVGVTKDSNTVGHIPREVSKVAWYFLYHGGEITCEIARRFLELDLVQRNLQLAQENSFPGIVLTQIVRKRGLK